MKQVPFGPVRYDILQLKRRDRKTINSIEELQEELDMTLNEASGNPITISDASHTNAEDFTVTLVPTQAGTGEPSPTNVRAISGLSSVNVILNDDTITLALGSTVYSGIVNFNTGVLTVDKVMVDMGDLTWSYNSTYQRFVTGDISNGDFPDSGSAVADILSSAYPTKSYNESSISIDYGVGAVLYQGAPYIGVRNKDYSDATAFKTAMDGVQLLYKLATPITTQLTAQQLRLLQGENELSTNGSSMSFSYQPDNLIGDLKSWVLDQLS